MITHKFLVPLNNRTQWDIWEQTLQDTLVSIIGTNGVSLSYVIREVDAQSIVTASLTGEKFLADSKMVHNIICSNIAEDYYAYTWIKPRLGDRNR